MRLTIPLCLLRIWCNQTNSWLSFETKNGDRYFIGQRGYFLELPDGSLAQIRPRVAFPTVERFPSLMFADLAFHRHAGQEVLFLSVPAGGPKASAPQPLPLEELANDLERFLPAKGQLEDVEHYVMLRLYESGIVRQQDLQDTVNSRNPGQTIGELLLQGGLCSWEPMLAVCLDTPSPNKLDPPSMRGLAQRREWELTGEILITLGKLRRSDLERGLQIKREGNQALGQLLLLMGACSEKDVEECVKLQRNLRGEKSAGTALIGQLLVNQGVIDSDDLDQVMRNQRVGRQSLERILLSMGICNEEDIRDFVLQTEWHEFQSQIDDLRLGEWLVKTGKLSRQQMEEALRVQMRGRQVMGEILVSLQMCSQEDIEGALSLQKKLRRDFESGIERLGSLLLKQGKISEEHLQEALDIQSIGRQPIGCILVAIEACRTEQVTDALNIQKKWREMRTNTNDRLGDVLVQLGAVGREQLEPALKEHFEQGKPLGRLLIEKGMCTPEQIIDVLIERDRARHAEFLHYLRRHIPWQSLSTAATSQIGDSQQTYAGQGSEPSAQLKGTGARRVSLSPLLRPRPQHLSEKEQLSDKERSIIARILSWIFKRNR